MQCVSSIINSSKHSVIKIEITRPVSHVEIQILEKEKSDSSKGLWSTHLLYVPPIFKLTSIHVHGFTPEDKLNGNIASLPKDGQGDSENDCGIFLFSCLTKFN